MSPAEQQDLSTAREIGRLTGQLEGLRHQVDQNRAEAREAHADLRDSHIELRDEVAKLGSEMRGGFADLKSEIQQISTKVTVEAAVSKTHASGNARRTDRWHAYVIAIIAALIGAYALAKWTPAPIPASATVTVPQ